MGDNSCKTRNDIKQILYLFHQHNNHQKSVQQLNEVIIMIEENMILTRDPETFCFNFDLAKDIDENLKREIEFLTRINESLAEIITKKVTEQLLSKYRYGYNIHEQGKQQNE